MQRSLMLFENSIHSPSTLKAYKYSLNKFIQYFKLKDFDSMASMDNKMMQEMVEDYVMHLKTKGLSRSSISMPVNALQLFCESNDVEVRWKKIRRMIPQQKKRTGKDAYTTDEINRMLQFELNIRNKAIIHFMAASGVRVGAIPGMKLKHLKQIDSDCMTVTVYADDLEEYTTFLTPEATKALQSYFEKRKSDGEFLDDESPVFREQYTIGISKPKPLSIRGIQATIERVLRRTNIRTGNDGKRRDVQLDHGFRKRFNTILKTTDGVKPLLAEKMMGNSVESIPLDEVYLTPTTEILFAEYKKAISQLIVDSSERKQFELDKALKEKSELQKVNTALEETLRQKDELAKNYRNAISNDDLDDIINKKIDEVLRKHQK